MGMRHESTTRLVRTRYIVDVACKKAAPGIIRDLQKLPIGARMANWDEDADGSLRLVFEDEQALGGVE